jgi:uncharacterized protein YndB with AHSA1/START domain
VTVERSVTIARPAEEVFAFLADARNDPRWCASVVACEQRSGDGPGLDASYRARHKPTPFHPVMSRLIRVVEYQPPRLVRWCQEDSNGVFHIAYELEPIGEETRFVQRDRIEWKVPGPVGRLAERLFVRRHIGEQMTDLKRLLEER